MPNARAGMFFSDDQAGAHCMNPFDNPCSDGTIDEMGRNRGNISVIGFTQLDPLYAGHSTQTRVKGDDVDEDEFRDEVEETANGGLTKHQAECTTRNMKGEGRRLTPQNFAEENVQNKLPMTKFDRIALSREARKNLGCYETEINFGLESHLQEYYDNCSKHPDHKNFVPVKQFSKWHLPTGYQHDEFFQLLKCLSNLTLRVEVSHVSASRPSELEGEIYPSYAAETETGNHFVRYGTGRILRVTRNNKKDPLCYCSDCKKSGDPEKTWWSIEVATARHVVFDDIEAENTVCRWGFDEEFCKFVDFNINSVIVSPDISADWAILRFVTHNGPIVHEIKENLKNYTRLCRELNEASLKSPKKRKLVAIVSHPHGCCKQITTGVWTSKDHQGGVDARLFYTTNTCTGSSGAPVYVLGQEGRLGWYSHIHSGTKLRDSKRSRQKNTKESINFSRMVGPLN
ncbi:uncharacterized protein LOC131950129 [Physella acuta]|uniref:uncharacterized protein LOC131950129 n=1 Tax=Physella acuta TaxID=109671 RepID=UPI0027DCD050|nr:uncharacterized protein LOC131950129 [Physella acuta]